MMGQFTGNEIELAAVGLLDGVAVYDLLGVAVQMYTAVDAYQFVGLAAERQKVVGDRDHGQ